MESSLPVVECFHSLQGEGEHAGRSAYFIRLASCKVGCSWCDTKDSWNSELHPQQSLIDLSTQTAKAQEEGAAFVVITGGEPLHHNLDDLCKEIRKSTLNLEKKSIPIHLETSGVDMLSGKPDWITLSPKRHSPPRLDNLLSCQELKVVIHNAEDLLFAKTMADSIKNNGKIKPQLFLQAGWENEEGQTLAIKFVKNNPDWRLSMQTHKWLGVL
ncbi:7-carboxy-7-deazaguanine synthase QueE [Prochlorococcus marinus]|uniref:7-carboxy-7-deazaguanine synthase n=1 Tax=Prochlorococcus marinus str. P0902-H212 TaxID=1620696 RepID=A0A0D5A2Z1_PROMR|nr:7-carboxy-7-deazaguanine synthase QueE [Prochlorococcus marinus]AJW30655.1 Queuosine Biosynthesis QueE Radical SAM [Prochlorococcus marinus str. P0902-H212]